MLLRLVKFVEYKMSMSKCKYTRIRNTDAIAFNTDHDKFSVFVCWEMLRQLSATKEKIFHLLLDGFSFK